MISIKPIASVRSPFKEKFGIPRQPQLCPAIKGEIIFEKNSFNIEALKDLEGNSHIWVIFHFNDLKKPPDKAKIRPPRLGGNKYKGVYSSRSPYRPNTLGMSLVALEEAEIRKHEIALKISGHDLLDGTPVFDIKPYSPCDQPRGVISLGWQETEWQNLEVEFSKNIEISENLSEQIKQLLSQDPRPAYSRKTEDKIYHMVLGNFEVSFSVCGLLCSIIEVKPLNNS